MLKHQEFKHQELFWKYFTRHNPWYYYFREWHCYSRSKVTETVPELKFVYKLNIFTLCQIKACNKKMAYYSYVLNCTAITCPSCGTSQRFASAKSGITARLCAEIDRKDIWFTAFNNKQKLLLKVNLTIWNHESSSWYTEYLSSLWCEVTF